METVKACCDVYTAYENVEQKERESERENIISLFRGRVDERGKAVRADEER